MELIFLFLFSFGSVLVIFSVYLGYFNPVKFEVGKLPEGTFALVPYVGSYKEATVKQVELLRELVALGLDVSTTVGIYFDDAKTIKDEACRALVGVEIFDVEAFDTLEVEAKLFTLAKEEAYVSSFAYKSGLSILLGISKVYPAFKKRQKRQGLEVYESIEVYDFKNKRLNYYFPKQSILSLWKTI